MTKANRYTGRQTTGKVVRTRVHSMNNTKYNTSGREQVEETSLNMTGKLGTGVRVGGEGQVTGKGGKI